MYKCILYRFRPSVQENSGYTSSTDDAEETQEQDVDSDDDTGEWQTPFSNRHYNIYRDLKHDNNNARHNWFISLACQVVVKEKYIKLALHALPFCIIKVYPL